VSTDAAADTVASRVCRYISEKVAGTAEETFRFLDLPLLAPDVFHQEGVVSIYSEAKAIECSSEILDTVYVYDHDGCRGLANRRWSDQYRDQIAIPAVAMDKAIEASALDLTEARQKVSDSHRRPSVYFPDEQLFLCPVRPRDWANPKSIWPSGFLEMQFEEATAISSKTLIATPPTMAMMSSASTTRTTLWKRAGIYEKSAIPQQALTKSLLATAGQMYSVMPSIEKPSVRDHRGEVPVLRPSRPTQVKAELRSPVLAPSTAPVAPAGFVWVRDHWERARFSPEVTSLRVRFEYLVVRSAVREWFHRPLVNRTDWYVPGKKRAEFSTPSEAGSLHAETTGFVAVRNLVVEGNWQAKDLPLDGTSAMAGPLAINFLPDGTVGHREIQTIGILFQDLPDLPPQDSPPDH
jgi:hypothetical protein